MIIDILVKPAKLLITRFPLDPVEVLDEHQVELAELSDREDTAAEEEECLTESTHVTQPVKNTINLAVNHS